MKLILTSILLLGLVFATSTHGRAEIDVGPGESIQAAINFANAGEEIWVKSGIYPENIDVNKSILLYGWDSGDGDPIVSAEHNGSAITLSPGSDGSEIEGLTIINSNDSGIMVKSDGNYINFVNVIDNNYGIYLNSSNDNIIYRNTVFNNNHGIYITSSNGNDLQGNDLKNIGSYDSYDDATDPGSNSWDSNRFTNHNSPHKIPGGSSVDRNPESNIPDIPNIKRHRHA